MSTRVRRLEGRARKHARKVRVRATYPTLRAVGNLAAERRFAANQPELSEVQRGLVETLRHDGIATTSFGELVGDSALWDQLAEEMQGFASEAEERASGRDGAPRAKGDYLIGGFARSNVRLLSYFTYVSPAAALAGRAPRSFAVSRSPERDQPKRSKFALD